MSQIALRVQSIRRPDEPLGEEAEVRGLCAIVRRGVAGDGAPLVGVAIRSTHIDLIDLDPVRDSGLPLRRFLAGLTLQRDGRGTHPVAVGLLGVVETGTADPAARALVFLEWSDGRWWHWRARVDQGEGCVVAGTEGVQQASQGDALPKGLGGWWAMGRTLQASKTRKVRPMEPGPEKIH
jgi:hypothetical protein